MKSAYPCTYIISDTAANDERFKDMEDRSGNEDANKHKMDEALLFKDEESPII